jgi:hypothetical protein
MEKRKRLRAHQTAQKKVSFCFLPEILSDEAFFSLPLFDLRCDPGARQYKYCTGRNGFCKARFFAHVVLASWGSGGLPLI